MAPKKKSSAPICPEEEIEKQLQKLKISLEDVLEGGKKIAARGEELEKKEKKTMSEAEDIIKSYERSCSEKIEEREDLIRQMAQQFTEYEEDTKTTLSDLHKKYTAIVCDNDSLTQELARRETRKTSEADIQVYKDKVKTLLSERDSLERKFEEEKKEFTKQKRKTTTEFNKEKRAAEKSFEKLKKDMQREFEKEKKEIREDFQRENQEIEATREREDVLKLKQRIKDLEQEAQRAKSHKRLIQSRLETQKKSIMNVMRESSPILPLPQSPLGLKKENERRKAKRQDDVPSRKASKVDSSVERELKTDKTKDDSSSVFVFRRRRRRVDMSTPPQKTETPPKKTERAAPRATPPSDIKVSCVRRFGKSKSRARSIAVPQDITNTHTPGSRSKKDVENESRHDRYQEVKSKSMAPPPKTSSFMDLTFSPLRLSHAEF